MGMIDVEPYQNNNQKSDFYHFWYFRTNLFTTIANDELVDHIAKDSKVERAKVTVANGAVTKQIAELLCNGHSIRIPHLGILKLSVTSTGAKTVDEYNAGQNITNVHLVLTPDKEIKEELKKMKYRKTYTKKRETPTPPTP